MKQKKKTGFFAFVFSFVPGAVEMYMGFFKMGMSLMCIFFLSIMIPTLMGASDIFMAVTMVLWFYGFFHARNLCGVEINEFETLNDRFIWEEFMDGTKVKFNERTGRLWMAWIMLAVGVGALWSNFRDVIFEMIPELELSRIYPLFYRMPGIIIAAVLIVFGIKLILGKKRELNELEYNENKGIN